MQMIQVQILRKEVRMTNGDTRGSGAHGALPGGPTSAAPSMSVASIPEACGRVAAIARPALTGDRAGARGDKSYRCTGCWPKSVEPPEEFNSILRCRWLCRVGDVVERVWAGAPS